ncbi:hypothetical protein ElyMa_002617100 [Elysia marginata]|uniref:CCHC-type domain-containing protein n=1 Tax=Elysia marginata TaxID=1093978 RepID=A0AAV4H6Y3_9GAST|nr:hypothetical protein ElyMa_002617100 [Elysia marginata]
MICRRCLEKGHSARFCKKSASTAKKPSYRAVDCSSSSSSSNNNNNNNNNNKKPGKMSQVTTEDPNRKIGTEEKMLTTHLTRTRVTVPKLVTSHPRDGVRREKKTNKKSERRKK